MALGTSDGRTRLASGGRLVHAVREGAADGSGEGGLMQRERNAGAPSRGRLGMRRRLVVSAVTLLGAGTAMLGAGAVGGPAGASGAHHSRPHSGGAPLTICEIAATSGPFSQLGANDMGGAKAWAALVNKQGGVDGHKVVLVPENDNSDPATAASLVRKCVEQVHANVIFGPEETSDSAAAIPVANQLHVLLLGWQSGWAGQGIPASELSQDAFPGIGNVFFADDLATVQNLIGPRHYTRVAVVQDNTTGGKGNAAYTASLGGKYHFKVVSTQTLTPGATDDTPAALALLKANPQIIVLGMTPGPDTITIIKAIRAQNPNIPISECSGCATPAFISAVGGPKAMHNVYLIGSPGNLASLKQTPSNAAAIADTKAYIAAMKANGQGSADQVNGDSEGWDTGRELQAAIDSAKSISTPALVKALSNQTLVTGGLQAYYWHRTPTNYANITRIVAAMATISPSGQPVVVNK